MDSVMIVQRENYERQKQRLLLGGFSQLQVITDFDRTLTTNFHNGRKTASLISALRESKILSADYNLKAQALYDYYHPLEDDPSLDLVAKKSLMTEWWRRHFDLLIASGLKRSDIFQVVDKNLSCLRDGADDFLQTLSRAMVPVTIFSASGLGISGLKYFFERKGLLSDNLSFVANDFVWDEEGRAKEVLEPIIHTFNKSATMFSSFGILDKVKNRNNVLLLGDSLGDVNMTAGLNHRAELRIAFLNDRILESLPSYRDVYDALVLNDGNFDLPLGILREIEHYAD